MIETKINVPMDVPDRRLLWNPVWWLMCGGTKSHWDAPLINNGEPYLPNVHNQLMRNIFWWIRNPFANFVGFIIGLEGVTFYATGPAPVLKNTGRDCTPQQFGFRWAILRTKYMVYPFISYWGGWFEFYLGWRPESGGFGLKMIWRKR